jgi:CDP-diacylglycerol--glycerol-3-phosphate 3-phosphatidyltransferase
MQISADTTQALKARRNPEAFWNAPNVITLSRIAAAPIVLLLALFPGPAGSALIGAGFLAVSLTDLLDGYLARRDGTVTRVGRLLDPLADKLLTMTAFIMLIALDRIPLWAVPLVMLILARETAVTGLRAMASAEGVILQASSLGKWKTGFQIAALTALILHFPWLWIPMHPLGVGLLIIATALTVWSGWDYFAAYLGGEAE